MTALRLGLQATEPYRKLAAALLVLVGGALIVKASTEMYKSRSEGRETLVALQRERAESAAALIEQFIRGIEGQVGAVASLPAGTTLDQRRAEFLRVLRQAPAITELSYLDSEGREQLKASRLAMDRLASELDMSQDPKFGNARANKRYVSPVYFRKVSEPYLTIAMAGPGLAPGAVVAEVSAKAIWDVISRMNRGMAATAYVLDEQGLIIAHRDIELALNKTDLNRLPHVALALKKLRDPNIEVPSVARDHLDREIVTASAPIGTLGMLVFVDLPLSEALRTVYDAFRWTIMLTLGVMLALLAGVWLRGHSALAAD